MYVKFPVNAVGITSEFGMRTHPITKVGRYHYGLDLGWIKYPGEPVYATHDATVIEESYNSSMGNHIVLKYTKGNNTIINIYMHLKARSLVKKGKKVIQGQKLGYMGETGLADGVHLHFEYWVCPKNYKYKSGEASKYAKNPLNYCYLFDDQTVTKNSSSKVNRVVGTPTTKNKNKNQIEVLKENLNCRTSPSLKGTILGYINLGYYNILEQKEQSGYTWYRIDYNKWVANVKDYAKTYQKEQPKDDQHKKDDTKQDDTKQDEQTKDDKTTDETNINLENYNSFKTPKDGYYYIRLRENEIVYYPKQKDSK